MVAHRVPILNKKSGLAVYACSRACFEVDKELLLRNNVKRKLNTTPSFRVGIVGLCLSSVCEVLEPSLQQAEDLKVEPVDEVEKPMRK